MTEQQPMIEIRRIIGQNAVQAIANLNCEANVAVVQRTRRIIRDKALGLEELKRQQRNHICLALATVLAVLMLLAPVIWNSLEDFVGGEHIADLSTQTAFLLLTLTPAILAALIATAKEHRELDRRRDS